MKDIRVKKADLILKLKFNRDAHRALVEKAWIGYRKKAVDEIDAALARVRSGSRELVMIMIPMPQDHTDDYNRALEMLEMSLDEEIILTEKDFGTLVLDKWEWSHGANVTNSTYAATAQ